jgi:hypothetical protein
MVGGSVSTTLMAKMQLLELPTLSMAVQRMSVVPFGKAEPAGGLQLTVALLQKSEALAA